ncbi:sulfatase-like hydrolase/transferase [Puia sp.]|uniref:sulfatase-like hydrolase/transferase n=1 Tax=Puia sp. TaxID=2045100 RepID=UPI002F3FD24E
MSTPRTILFLIAGLTSTAPANAQKAAMDERPNIVVILADDMGYSDIGCYGGEIHTPNLDWLAANGLRFSSFHNTSRCCPSRAQLLTGLYNHQAGIGSMTTDQQEPGYRGFLTPNTVTLAEALETAGYQTAMAGKWHVSNTIEQATPAAQLKWLDHQIEAPLFSPIEQYPTRRGFQRFYGTLWGVVDHFDPFSLVDGETPVRSVPKNYYHTDAVSDSAAAFVRDMSRNPQPFFLYLAYNSPHWPVQAPAEEIEKYKNTYRAGWEAIRKARYARMVKMGIVDPATQPLSLRNPDSSWSTNRDSAWDARVMAVHAAMIDRMDQGIGRVIEALRSTGRLDNTLIVFLSDNGASPEVAQTMPPGFDRPSATRDGQRIIYPADKKTLPGPETVYASIGPAWANVANTPYRYWKIESYEGGTRTPFIAFWPKGLRTHKGGITAQNGYLIDLMPTFLDLAKGRYPDFYHGHAITPMQGTSLIPVLEGHDAGTQRVVFNEHHNGRSVRKGRWKLVSANADTAWELYDLSRDGTEEHNLVHQFPDTVRLLDNLWQQWARDNKVLPRPAPRARPATAAKREPAKAAPAHIQPDTPLTTPWTAQVSQQLPHPEYPRPQFVRAAWANLNGPWDYAITGVTQAQPPVWEGKILVPYPVESLLSGVRRSVGPDSLLWVHRRFSVDTAWQTKRILLHFGAVDWKTRIWINGRELPAHEGGYDAFSYDITDALQPGGEQELTLAVWDPGNQGYQPNGKQYNNPRSIWYTPTTGIWQTVWLEPVSPLSIPAFTIQTDIDRSTVRIALHSPLPAGCTLRATVHDKGALITGTAGTTDTLVLPVRKPKLWTPDHPFLYDLQLVLYHGGEMTDVVKSYFGIRQVDLQNDRDGVKKLFLNHEPLFEFGMLDQGFWPDGLYTAPTDEALGYDIKAQKEAGFNLIRKHVKVEPDRWYYWCDSLGMLVWQDMPSGDRHIGKTDSDIVRTAQSAEQYRKELTAMVTQHSSHPSIVAWVDFNEGWGQFATADIVAFTRHLDPTRWVNATSGWSDRDAGDMHDTHSYPGPDMTAPEPNRATVLGEYGGQALLVPGHCWVNNLALAPGHIRTSQTPEDLLAVYGRLVDSLVILKRNGLSAAVYTQSTDVESEVNGLLTYDRKVWKIDIDKLRAINARVMDKKK